MNASVRRGKRSATDEEDGLPRNPQKLLSNHVPPVKKARGDSLKPKKKVTKPKAVINEVPSKDLNVYVVGTNEGGEMGLGAKGTNTEYRRPRLNPTLASVGVVHLAPGGMHCAALTRNNTILTWGVNDLGALGRDTEWNGGYVDMKTGADAGEDGARSDSDDSENGLNPREATPTAVDGSFFRTDTIFVQLAATDSATFALTTEGLVYGWGTFKSGDGKCGFLPSVARATRPVLIPSLRDVTKLASGSNHAIALTNKGAVLTWGYGEQYQTGRRVVDRTKTSGLEPRPLGLSKDIIDIGAGNEHSFAVHKNGDVYVWRLNNFAQAGIGSRGGGDFQNIMQPTLVESLRGHGKVICIGGGNHHSFAVTDKGECFTWGRCDAFALGIKLASLPPEKVISDDRGKPRILTVATRVPHFDNAVFAAAGSDQSIGVARDGKTFSWGYSINGETGQGAADDVEEATLIAHSSIAGKKVVWAGCGGHFSVIAEEVGELTNGKL